MCWWINGYQGHDGRPVWGSLQVASYFKRWLYLFPPLRQNLWQLQRVDDEWSQFCVLCVTFDLFIFEMSPSCRWGGAKIKDHRDTQNKPNNIIHVFQQSQADSVNIFGDFVFWGVFLFFKKGGQKKSPTARTTGSFLETFCGLQVLMAVVWTATTAVCLPQTEEGPGGSSDSWQINASQHKLALGKIPRNDRKQSGHVIRRNRREAHRA